jgi:hypothetical protein
MISEQLSRITNLRNKIRNVMVSWGVVESSADLNDISDAIENIPNQGAVSGEVKEGETYTIPKGYHSGAGTIKGVSGGGNYTLQDKGAITPTKKQQTVTPDSGYYGISSVTVEAIPEAYQDVTSVTATAADVLVNKRIVDTEGNIVAGTMKNNGAQTAELTTAETSVGVAEGYHNGSGSVSVKSTTATVKPTVTEQVIADEEGAFYSQVTVEAIDTEVFADVTDATVTSDTMLKDTVAYGVVDGVAAKITGTIAVNGDVSGTIDGINTTSYSVPTGYTTGGTVSLTDDIEKELAKI